MFTTIEKYMKDRLHHIVFIELKKDTQIENDQLNVIKQIPIPIHTKELIDLVKQGKDVNTISLASMARGMIYLIGLDSKFKYIPQYKFFLYQYDKNIENYICYEGLKFADQRNFYEGLIYFKSLLSLNLSNINGLYNYARCCEDIGKEAEDKNTKKDFTKEAMEIFEMIIQKYPDFSQVYYHLGFHYANQKLFKKAQLTWEECLRLGIDGEKKGEILYQLDALKDYIQYEEGYTYILKNQPDLGIQKLLPLFEKYSDWWNLIFFIALGYRSLKKYKEAIKYFEKVLVLKPTQVDTLNELGICYAALNDYMKAEKYLKKAVKFSENDSEILSNIGIVYFQLQKYDLAREFLRKSIAINPKDEITKKCLEKLEAMKA